MNKYSNLKERRLGVGITLEEFADLAGLEPRTIRDIENGKSNPREKTQKYLDVAIEKYL